MIFYKKGLDRFIVLYIVHDMNQFNNNPHAEVGENQLRQFQNIIAKLFQCCQERMQYQSEKFELPEAEMRCLMLFGEARYLTPKRIAEKMNVVKSRVSKIMQGLIQKNLIQRIKDPGDSRIKLLSLTAYGHKKYYEISAFMDLIHHEVLLHMVPEQRKILLTNLDILGASMESVKELMV